MSCLTLSSHLYLGLPCDLLVRGFHLNIFLTTPVSDILCIWPNQLSLWALIWLTIFLCFTSLTNSSLVLILHISFSFVGPNILLKIISSTVRISNLEALTLPKVYKGIFKATKKFVTTFQVPPFRLSVRLSDSRPILLSLWMSVRLSKWNSMIPTGWFLWKFIDKILTKICRHFFIWLRITTQMTDTLREYLRLFVTFRCDWYL